MIRAVAARAIASGCSDPCGPGGAATTIFIGAESSPDSFTYGNFTGGLNNDCSDPATPNIISLTILGHQTDGTGLINLCVPHPDKLGGKLAIGSDVILQDFTGDNGACHFTTATPALATITAHGLCDNGKSSAGFALEFSGFVQYTLAPGGCPSGVRMTALSGTVAVAAQ